MTTLPLIKFDRVPMKAYHTSNPFFREQIAKQGLIPKTFQQSEQTWLTGRGLEPIIEAGEAVLFAVLSNNQDDCYQSTYDDDIYEIDITQLKNTWYHDPNFIDEHNDVYSNNHCLTFEPIPLSAIKLIYQGTGE